MTMIVRGVGLAGPKTGLDPGAFARAHAFGEGYKPAVVMMEHLPRLAKNREGSGVSCLRRCELMSTIVLICVYCLPTSRAGNDHLRRAPITIVRPSSPDVGMRAVSFGVDGSRSPNRLAKCARRVSVVPMQSRRALANFRFDTRTTPKGSGRADPSSGRRRAAVKRIFDRLRGCERDLL